MAFCGLELDWIDDICSETQYDYYFLGTVSKLTQYSLIIH